MYFPAIQQYHLNRHWLSCSQTGSNWPSPQNAATEEHHCFCYALDSLVSFSLILALVVPIRASSCWCAASATVQPPSVSNFWDHSERGDNISHVWSHTGCFTDAAWNNKKGMLQTRLGALTPQCRIYQNVQLPSAEKVESLKTYSKIKVTACNHKRTMHTSDEWHVKPEPLCRPCLVPKKVWISVL